MRRLTLGAAKSTLARVIGKCESSPDVAMLANEAQERLLNRPNDPIGSYGRFRVCVGQSNCLTLPREVRTVKAYWINSQPGRFYSEFFEAIGWNEGGMGLRDEASWSDGATMLDQGTDCVFDQPSTSSTSVRKLQVVASDASDNGKRIVIRYVDSNGNRVYTNIDGVVQEGEAITLSTAGTLTASAVATGGIYHIVKDVTNYPVRIYEYDTTALVQTALLAMYAPSETLPLYRKVLVPGLTNMAGCCRTCTPGTDSKVITITARLQHVPVVVDNDPFVIGNLAALKLFVMGIKLEEQRETNEAMAKFNQAAAEVDGEIAAYLGDGMRVRLQMPDVGTWGAGGVLNPVGGWGTYYGW